MRRHERFEPALIDGFSSLPKMLGMKRMPRPLLRLVNEKIDENRRLAGMRLRPVDSPLGFAGQLCVLAERYRKPR